MGSAAEVPSLVLVKLKQPLAARAQTVAKVLAMGLELLQSDIRVAALEVVVPSLVLVKLAVEAAHEAVASLEGSAARMRTRTHQAQMSLHCLGTPGQTNPIRKRCC